MAPVFPFFFLFVSYLLVRWQRKVGVVGSCRGRGLVEGQENSVRVAVEGWDETGSGAGCSAPGSAASSWLGTPGRVVHARAR